MENFPEKMQELQDQGLLEELTPEETEALKGGYAIDYHCGTPWGPLDPKKLQVSSLQTNVVKVISLKGL